LGDCEFENSAQQGRVVLRLRKSGKKQVLTFFVQSRTCDEFPGCELEPPLGDLVLTFPMDQSRPCVLLCAGLVTTLVLRAKNLDKKFVLLQSCSLWVEKVPGVKKKIQR
jgi:hypothetical protein